MRAAFVLPPEQQSSSFLLLLASLIRTQVKGSPQCTQIGGSIFLCWGASRRCSRWLFFPYGGLRNCSFGSDGESI